MKELHSKKIKCPVGLLTLVAHDEALIAVLWEKEIPGRVRMATHTPLGAGETHPILDQAILQLSEYFRGKRGSFNIPLEPQGTEFQKRVWHALQQIPYGSTTSYSSLARKIGSPQAHRAVGSANGKNPLSILIPCHRVIGKSGRLSGFAGGIKNKSYLVEFEARINLVETTGRPV